MVNTKKNRLKAFVSILLAAIMLLAPGVISDGLGVLVAADSPVRSISPLLSEDEQSIYSQIYNGLYNHQAEIKIEDSEIGESWINDVLFPIYFRVIYENPELFYAEFSISLSYMKDVYVSITPKYTIAGSELASARAEYEDGLNKIIEGISPSWSDVEKVVYVNDYLTSHFSYDLQKGIYDAYNFFKDGTGVCQAYSAAFIAAMKELDIPASYAISESMNHMWNLVKVDGQWYHIDVTWNDPLPDSKGRAKHINLLLSDTAIEETGHYDWVADYTCSSTKYDNYFWKDYNKPFVYINDAVYSVNSDATDGGVYTVNLEDGTESLVFNISDKWYVDGSSSRYWVGCYSGIGAYSGKICYNTPDKIKLYDPKTGNHSTAFTYTGSGSIYGFQIEGNVLTYYVGTSPTAEMTGSGTVILSETQDYKITYVSDGSVYEIQVYQVGENITPPEAPTKDGYLFKGWSKSLPSIMPESDITVEAVFECAHTKTHVERKEATCVDDGYIRTICDVCGEVISEEIIPATGEHSFGDWVVVKEPTETSEGLRQRTCEVCGEVVKETIPMLPSTLETTSSDASEQEVSDVEMQDESKVEVSEVSDESELEVSEVSDADIPDESEANTSSMEASTTFDNIGSLESSDESVLNSDDYSASEETMASKREVSQEKNTGSINGYIYIIVAISLIGIIVIVVVIRMRKRS